MCSLSVPTKRYKTECSQDVIKSDQIKKKGRLIDTKSRLLFTRVPGDLNNFFFANKNSYKKSFYHQTKVFPIYRKPIIYRLSINPLRKTF